MAILREDTKGILNDILFSKNRINAFDTVFAGGLLFNKASADARTQCRRPLQRSDGQGRKK